MLCIWVCHACICGDWVWMLWVLLLEAWEMLYEGFEGDRKQIGWVRVEKNQNKEI